MDWDAHGISIRKHYHLKHFITKYLHDWLPVGKLIKRYKEFYTAKCPSCDHEEEDRTHFLLCPSRIRWVNELIKDLSSFFTNFPTRPALKDILIEGIRAWSTQTRHVFTTFPSLYQALLRNQSRSRVGWDQILLGRFVLEWRELQDDFLSTYPRKKSRHSGLTWVTGVIQVIWRHVHAQWKVRNKAQHGEVREARERILVARAQRATEALYAIKNDVLPRDRELFYSSLEEHYEYESTSTGLNQWLLTWKPVILNSVQESVKRGLRGVSSILSHFSS